jgi:hypothetical protein
VQCGIAKRLMSALGQKQTWRREIVMSALPPKADITERQLDVRFVPITDIGQCCADVRFTFNSGGSSDRAVESKFRWLGYKYCSIGSSPTVT